MNECMVQACPTLLVPAAIATVSHVHKTEAEIELGVTWQETTRRTLSSLAQFVVAAEMPLYEGCHKHVGLILAFSWDA